MSSNTLYRLSGGVLLAGGLLMAIGVVGALFIIGGSPPGSPIQAGSLLFLLAFLVMVCGLVLVVAGLPGMYVRQARRTGGLGLLGFVLTVFGVLLDLGLALIFATILPWLATAAPQLLNFANGGQRALLVLLYGAFLLLGVGSLVLGIATTQAGVLPRVAGVLLIASGIANLIAIPSWLLGLAGFSGQFLLAGGLAWIGYVLVGGRIEEAVQPSLPSADVHSSEVSS
jgi:hypothetical protein